MPVHHQEEQVISCAIPASFRSLKEGLDLSWIKEVFPSMRIGNTTFNITRNGKVTHWLAFLSFLGGLNMPLLTKS